MPIIKFAFTFNYILQPAFYSKSRIFKISMQIKQPSMKLFEMKCSIKLIETMYIWI